MERKNKLGSPLLLVGTALCVALIVVAFAIPRIGIDSNKIADMMMGKVEEAFESAKDSDGVSGIDLDAFQQAIQNEENMEKAKEQIVVAIDAVIDNCEKKGIPTRLTNWQIISFSYKKIYNLLSGGNNDSYDEMMQQYEDSQAGGTNNVILMHKKVSVGFGLFRILIGIMTLLPFITLIFIILNFIGVLSKIPMLVSTWTLAVMDVAYWVVWCLVFPRILGQAINQICDSILGFNSIFEMHSSAFASAVLGTMNMNGFLLWNIFTVLLVAWSVLCVVFNSASANIK